MSEAFNVAIIGAGIGAEHLLAYLELPARFSVVTVCDLDKPRAASIADSHGIAVTTDFQQVLSDPAVDLVDICLPPNLHFDTACQAIEAGKHVICEKPLVSSVHEADALTAVVNASRCRLFPVFQYRYGLATEQLQALISAGLAGKPYVASIETHWNRGADYYSVPWRGTFAGEQGGAVLCHAIHNHDLLCRFFGPVHSVCAMTATRVNPIETEDCASISFAMQNGALASSSISLGAATDTTRLRFCFEQLTAESGCTPYAPATDQWVFSARDPQQQSQVDQIVQQVHCEYSGYTGYFNAIADALQGNAGKEVLMSDGRRSIELVAAIYQSAREHRMVALPLDHSSEFYHHLHGGAGDRS
ncbi:MAG: Gfo/Idh/MocA family oxidoreductase [Pseudomonadota bacterium]